MKHRTLLSHDPPGSWLGSLALISGLFGNFSSRPSVLQTCGKSLVLVFGFSPGPGVLDPLFSVFSSVCSSSDSRRSTPLWESVVSFLCQTRKSGSDAADSVLMSSWEHDRCAEELCDWRQLREPVDAVGETRLQRYTKTMGLI
ncbi:hypothetical protein NDU88_001993 [Pleurodeles waltl]|uniref:Uncharacterized protein n=1 Tax=Pleurodeles waltl TaxID=8319 RepID=A0AAV7KTD5_PLEWA|nr:hypothetical protein NDU88_001993 [Pleurodeles waltl]